MKTLINTALAMVLGLALNTNAYSAFIISGGTYNGTNVGSVDTFLVEDDKQGNPQAETDWVKAYFSSSAYSYTVKQDPVTYYATNDPTVFAFLFDPTPGDDYFIIKNATRVALFENLANLNWGVFDTDDLSSAMNLPDTSKFEISHVTRIDGPATGPGPIPGVPEPNVLALFAAALLGFKLTSKKFS